MSKRCPTPSKVAHPSKNQAEKHKNGLYAKEGLTAMVHVYKCPCGAWHVGGRRKRFGRKRVQW